jgi:hypothetical protein
MYVFLSANGAPQEIQAGFLGSLDRMGRKGISTHAGMEAHPSKPRSNCSEHPRISASRLKSLGFSRSSRSSKLVRMLPNAFESIWSCPYGRSDLSAPTAAVLLRHFGLTRTAADSYLTMPNFGPPDIWPTIRVAIHNCRDLQLTSG